MDKASHKALHILLILHLSLTTFSVVTRPNECFCGQACEHSLYDRMETGHDTPYHNRCLGSGCTTCNIERIMNFDPDNLQTAGYGRKICGPAQTSNISNDVLSAKDTIVRMDWCYSQTPTDGSPIYLQTLSLLL
jgi:hypothetical protein